MATPGLGLGSDCKQLSFLPSINATFSAFLCFFLVISLVAMAPKSGAPKCREAGPRLSEKVRMSDELLQAE